MEQKTESAQLCGPLDGDVAGKTTARRFRWQIVPGTLQLIFGSVGLLAGPIMAYEIWQRRKIGVEAQETDVLFWCAYVVIGFIACACLLIAGGVEWFRCRNKIALMLTAAALAGYVIVHVWLNSRFPGML